MYRIDTCSYFLSVSTTKWIQIDGNFMSFSKGFKLCKSVLNMRPIREMAPTFLPTSSIPSTEKNQISIPTRIWVSSLCPNPPASTCALPGLAGAQGAPVHRDGVDGVDA